MAKKHENKTNSLVTASDELGKVLITLYKSKSFTRAGKDLADTLFKSGVQAGALVSGIAELTERSAKISAANEAILKLNEVLYIAKIMQTADYYRPSQVNPLVAYVQKMIKGLRELLHNVPEVRRRIHVHSTFGMTAVNPGALSAVQKIAAPAADNKFGYLPAAASAPVETATLPAVTTTAPAVTPPPPVETDELEEEIDDGNEQMTIPLPEEGLD